MKDLSEFLTFNFQKENDPNHSINIEVDDITMKTKLVVRSSNIAIRFDEKSFFSTILCCDPNWDYSHYNEYINQTVVNLSTIKKIHLKCDVIDGSVVNGLRQPILYDFVLDKPSGYKAFSRPERIHYKKINKSALNTIAFHLEDDVNEEYNFNEEMFTFTLQMIKNWTFK